MEKSTNLFKSKNINTAMLKLAYPSIIAMLSTAIQQIITTAFIGITNDSALQAAISLSFPLFTAINALGQMVGIGASAAGGRKLGNNEQKTFSGIAAFSLLLAIIIGILVAVLGLIFLKPLATFLGADNDTEKYANSYLFIIVLAACLPILNMVFNNLFRALGKVLHSMNTMLIAAASNVALDALFLFVFDLKAIGLALALVISQGLAVLYSIIFFIIKKEISLKEIKNVKKLEVIKEVTSVGLPTFLMQLLASISFGILNSAASKISTAAVAGFGIGNKIYMLIFQTILGYTQAFLPFCAFNYGQKEFDRLQKGLKFSLIITISISLLFTAIFLFFSTPISKLFSQNSKVINAAAKSLLFHSILLPGVAFIQTLTVYFQGVKKPFFAGTLSLSRQGLFLIPLSLVMPNLIKDVYLGVILAQPLADLLCLILTIFIFIYHIKNRKKST